MKAVISNKIYLPYTEELAEKVKKELTYSIKRKTMVRGQMLTIIEKIRLYSIIDKAAIVIPQGRADLIPPDAQIIDKRSVVPANFPEPKIPLFDYQKPIVNSIEDSCFLNAKVGWGKTFAALHVMKNLGQRTLIITHNTFIRDQWKTSIKKLFDIDCGIIGSGIYNVNHDVVVANIQTLVGKVDTLTKDFGLVILDEAHHCPAVTFKAVIDKLHSRYRIGLSATINRIDGLDLYFENLFGRNIIKPEKNNTLDPTVKILQTNVMLPEIGSWADRMTAVSRDEEYRTFILNVTKHQIKQGHKVLIIADRLEFLEYLKENLGDRCGLVTGGTSFTEREEICKGIDTDNYDCIAGIRSIFSEGISVEKLSCLILASVIANEISIDQISGRIMRKHPDKLNPIIIDINFSNKTDRKYSNIRLGFYLRQGWEVERL